MDLLYRLSKIVWGIFFFICIKIFIWICKQIFELIKLIFGGIFYFIGWIWSSIFSREKKPKQETQERAKTENLVQCTECGSMEPSSLMTFCPDCGALLCSDCRKHHNCTTQIESCSCEEEISHTEENHGDYKDEDEHLINYGDVQSVHNPQPVKKKSTGEARALILIGLGLVFLFLFPVIGILSPIIFGLIGLFIIVSSMVSSKGVKITLAVILFILLFMITGFIPVAISFPILAGIGIYIIYLCINPQRENTCSKNEQLITCTECGIQEPISLMTTCPVCGAILCSSCKRYHGCINDSESLIQQSKMNGVDGPIVNSSSQELITCMGCGEQHPKSSMRKCHTCGAVLCPACRKHHTCGEEMVECMGCGERHPKSSMRKCHICGDILCPSCRKHHVCGSRKKESMDDFLESEPQLLNADISNEETLSEYSVNTVVSESPSEEAEEWYRKAKRYYEGDGVEKDLKQAIHWYTKAADADHTMAQLTLGLCLLLRRDSGDFDQASHWLGVADKKGFVPSEMMSTIADAFREGNYYDEALYWYTKGAEQGVAEAQYKLGLNYIADIIVRTDYKKAAHWFEKADKQGYADAHERYGYSLYAVGNSYFYGWNGYAEDEVEAVKWYEKSALSGYAGGQRKLGCCYLHGEGVRQNYETAIHWLKKAVEQDDPEAKTLLGCMYVYGDHLPEDEGKGFRLIKEAAEAKEPDEDAFVLLGTCYCDGIGVRQDLDKARYWLQKSIDAGVNLDDVRKISDLYPMLRLSF